MIRVRLMAVMLVAVFCVAAVGATSALGAVAKGELVGEAGGPLIKGKLTGKGGEATLESIAKSKIVCTSIEAKGETSKLNTKKGTQEAKFKGCVSNGLKCKTATGAEGEIITNTVMDVVITKEKAETDNVVNSLAAPVVITCGGVKDEVKEAFCSDSIATPTAAENETTVKATQTAGKQTVQECGGNKVHLESSFAGGAFEEAGQAGSLTIKLEEKVKFQ